MVDLAQSLLESLGHPLLVLDADLRVQRANPAFCRAFHVSAVQTKGQFVYDVGNGRWDIPQLRGLLEQVIAHNKTLEGVEVEYQSPEFDRKSFLLNARRADLDEEDAPILLLAFEDVTQRKRAREQIAWEHALIRSSNYAIVLHALDGLIATWNPAAERLYGWSAEEAIGRHISFLLPPDRLRELADNLERSRRGETVEKYETTRVCKDGKHVDVVVGISPLHDQSGLLIGISKIAREITVTERRRAKLESRQREQEALVAFGQHALNDNLGVLMERAVATVAATLDTEFGDVLELRLDGKTFLLRAGMGWNEGLVGDRTVGAGVESEAGFALLSQRPVVIEDLSTETRFSAPPLLVDHGVVSGVSVLIRGRNRPFGVLGAHTAKRRLFDEDDVRFLQSVANVLASAIESGHAREAMARDALLLANVRDSVIVTDLEGVVTYWNEGATRLFGWQAEEMLGRPYPARYGDRDAQSFVEGTIQTIARGSEWSDEWHDYRKDGSRVWIEVRVSRINDASGNPVGVLGVSRDITERKQVQESLQLAHEKLEQRVSERTAELAALNAELLTEMEERKQLETQLQEAQRLEVMNIMAGSIAHELNQPLTAIVNYAKGCIRRLDAAADEGGELRAAMGLVADEAHRAAVLIRRLRDLAKRRSLEIKPNPLNDTIGQAIFIMEPLIRASGVKTVRDFSAESQIALFDRLLITQVLFNLIRNGVEAMEQTQPSERQLTIETLENGSGFLQVNVHDTGVGVSREGLANLFTPFNSSKPGGMGLGLSVSKNIIELHGGQLWVAPRECVGTSFHFTLPMP